MNTSTIKRGDIIWAELPKLENTHIQQGCRPMLVVSNDTANLYSPVLIVLAITSKKKKDLPVHVNIEDENCKLKKNSMCLAEQVYTIDKSNIISIGGHLTKDSLEKINQAIKIQMGV